MATTIGTSTNLIVVELAEELGAEEMGLFYFTFPVLVAGSLGVVFLWLVAPRLLPEREAIITDFSPRVFSALLHVTADSFAAGKTLAEVLGRTENRMSIVRIERGKGLFGEGLFIAKLPSVTIQPGDKLYVNDSPENLKEFESLLEARLHNVANTEYEEGEPIDEDHPLTAEGQQLAEVVVTRGSFLHHRTLNSVRFVDRYKLLPLAIHRAKSEAVDSDGDLGEIPMRAGDVLLVQGSEESVADLRRGGAMLVLDGTSDLPSTHHAKRALLIMLFVVVCAGFRWLPISVSALIGAAGMILTRVLTWRNLTDALSTPVIMIIVVSLALGHAMIYTGAADYIADVFVVAVEGLPVPVVLSGLMFLMMVLTNVVSNTAAAVIGTPISIGVANSLGVSIEPFVLAVIFGANMSFATPMGYQTNLLVFSAGGYKFSDFLRVGIPLSLIMWLAFSFLLPLLYDI